MSLAGGLSGFILVAQRRKPTIANLTPSGPVTITSNGQIVQNLLITAPIGHGIDFGAFDDVVIKDVEIHIQDTTPAQKSYSISGFGGARPSVDGARIFYDAHATGQNPNDDQGRGRINLENCTESVLTRITSHDCASVILMKDCSGGVGPRLSFIEGHNVRGPIPRGQLVQAINTDNGILTDWSLECDPNESWPEDAFNTTDSIGWVVRRGLVDGNNSETGWCIQQEQRDGRVTAALFEDIDAINWGQGAFAGNGGTPKDSIYRRCRAKDSICGSQGRGVPTSGSLLFGAKPTSNFTVDDCSHFNLCNPTNLFFPTAGFNSMDTTLRDFTPRAPIRNLFYWT